VKSGENDLDADLRVGVGHAFMPLLRSLVYLLVGGFYRHGAPTELGKAPEARHVYSLPGYRVRPSPSGGGMFLALARDDAGDV
jgi:hypothetical protein